MLTSDVETAFLSQLRYTKLKHCCLACYVLHGEVHLDSEWHAFCDCPCLASARRRFEVSSGISVVSSVPSTPDDFVNLFKTVRSNMHLSNRFSFFALDVRSTRRHLFRRLTSDGLSGRVKVTLRLTFQRWRVAFLEACWSV